VEDSCHESSSSIKGGKLRHYVSVLLCYQRRTVLHGDRHIKDAFTTPNLKRRYFIMKSKLNLRLHTHYEIKTLKMYHRTKFRYLQSYHGVAPTSFSTFRYQNTALFSVLYVKHNPHTSDFFIKLSTIMVYCSHSSLYSDVTRFESRTDNSQWSSSNRIPDRYFTCHCYLSYFYTTSTVNISTHISTDEISITHRESKGVFSEYFCSY
jgi:hypothetical protein